MGNSAAIPSPSRRSWTRAALAALGVIALLAVAGCSAYDRSSSGPHSTPTRQARPRPTLGTRPTPVPGWRYEYYRDVRLQVPPGWGYGNEPAGDWCADSPGIVPKQPYVSRNDLRGVFMISCPSARPPLRIWVDHVSFSGAPAPDRTNHDGRFWVATRRIGHATVRVVATDHQLVYRILGSAQVVGSRDHRCEPHSAIQSRRFQRPASALDLAKVRNVRTILVCQYLLPAASTPTEPAAASAPGLLAATALTGPAARRELQALQAAPRGGGPDRPKTCSPGQGQDAIVLHLLKPGADRQVYVNYSACRNNGFDDGTAIRRLTRPACRPLFRPPVEAHSVTAAVAGLCTNWTR